MNKIYSGFILHNGITDPKDSYEIIDALNPSQLETIRQYFDKQNF